MYFSPSSKISVWYDIESLAHTLTYFGIAWRQQAELALRQGEVQFGHAQC